MKKIKQKLTVFIFGIFLFAGTILPVTVFAQDYEDSPFGISIGGFLSNQDYSKSLQYMNEAGTNTVRFMSKWGGLSWEQVEPQKGVFDWSKTDEYYSEAIKNNLDIMVNIYPDNPEWDDPGNEYTLSYPIDMDEYLNFINKTAERYPEITSWILGVELERNDDLKWWTGTPEEYADLFVKTYTAIKNVNPDAIVMTYGNNVYLSMENGGIDTFSKPVLAEIKKLIEDIHDFSFAYAIHYYETNDINLYIDMLNYTRSMLDEYGFTEIPIVMTDMAPFLKKNLALKERKVAEHIIKTYTMGFAHNLKSIIWAQLSDGNDEHYGSSFEAGLISNPSMSQQDSNYYKNLGFYTYKLMTEKLEGFDWNNITTIIDNDDNKYAYKFINDNTGEPTYVAWWNYFDDTTYAIGDSNLIILSGISANHVIITNAVPTDTSGIYITDYNTAFSIDTLSVTSGSVSFYLKESPVFVEEYNASSVNDIIFNDNIKIYPNPTNGIFTIQGKNIQSIEVLNISGQTIKQLSNNQSTIINLKDQRKGIYMIKMVTDKGISVEKLVLE